jgi:hypothetical protein
MKSSTLARLVLPLLAVTSCANTAPSAPPAMTGAGATGGAIDEGGAGGGGSGGSSGTGGGAGVGGRGGSDTGGTGGSAGGTGGSDTGGTGGGAGSGGAGATGGVDASDPNSIGGPDAAADVSVMTGDPSSIVGGFDGALLSFPCGGSATGFDCANVGCTGKEVTHTTEYKVGGQPGTVYNMTFRVRGVVEGYQYQGGMRDQGTASQATNPDFFYQGGDALAAGARGSDYNTYQLTVTPPVAGAPNKYFLNSIPVNPRDPGAVHLTFVIDYTKTIKISGGGTITFSTYDSNCRTVMNCEKSANNNCANHWTVPLTGAMPPPPATFSQPFQAPTGQFGQWVFIDVLSVSAAK